ncbi:LicD family protein [Flavobacterium sp. UBA6046]|jgi:hypothetical protein|uniref:LicD family protein n=1 Tax=Flavobacterium sp. UBA6046 TaxID=1946552 RepID=UPI0025C2A9BB|nr:LicD family protein [Flavobacterium sp. UBA6046]
MEKSEKFFNEAGGGHYDIRFFRGKVEIASCQKIILDALDAFSDVCNNIDIKAIIMHGALIGWHWNKRLLPWDDDVDFCIAYGDLLKLEKIFQTYNSLYDRKKYLFEINPNHKNRTTLNRSHHNWIEPNKIDARFIDKQTGLFLDITALSPIDDKRLSTKCPHIYQISDIFPLQYSILEGRKVYLPVNVPQVLTQEYGTEVLYKKIFAGYFFNLETDRWQPIDGSMVDNL